MKRNTLIVLAIVGVVAWLILRKSPIERALSAVGSEIIGEEEFGIL